MSNFVNFFGGRDLTLGPANLYYDPIIQTGDGGENLFLGGTQGLSLSPSVEKADLTKDQYGTSAADRVVTGQSLTLSASLVELQLDRLNAVLQGFEHYMSTGGSTLGFTWENVLGQADSDILKPMKIVLVKAGNETTDPDEILYVCNTAPMVDTELVFDASSQRVLALEWHCYRRPKYVSAETGNELFWFSQSALNNGLVTIST